MSASSKCCWHQQNRPGSRLRARLLHYWSAPTGPNQSTLWSLLGGSTLKLKGFGMNQSWNCSENSTLCLWLVCIHRLNSWEQKPPTAIMAACLGAELHKTDRKGKKRRGKFFKYRHPFCRAVREEPEGDSRLTSPRASVTVVDAAAGFHEGRTGKLHTPKTAVEPSTPERQLFQSW